MISLWLDYGARVASVKETKKKNDMKVELDEIFYRVTHQYGNYSWVGIDLDVPPILLTYSAISAKAQASTYLPT